MAEEEEVEGRERWVGLCPPVDWDTPCVLLLPPLLGHEEKVGLHTIPGARFSSSTNMRAETGLTSGIRAAASSARAAGLGTVLDSLLDVGRTVFVRYRQSGHSGLDDDQRVPVLAGSRCDTPPSSRAGIRRTG